MVSGKSLFVHSPNAKGVQLPIVGRWHQIETLYCRDNAQGRALSKGDWYWGGELSKPDFHSEKDQVFAEVLEPPGDQQVVVRTFHYRSSSPSVAEIREIVENMGLAVASRTHFESPLGFFVARETNYEAAENRRKPKIVYGYVSKLHPGVSYYELMQIGGMAAVKAHMAQFKKDPVRPVLEEIKHLEKAGLRHGHLHFGNIMVDEKGVVALIDPTRLHKVIPSSEPEGINKDLSNFLIISLAHGAIEEHELIPALMNSYGASHQEADRIAQHVLTRLESH